MRAPHSEDEILAILGRHFPEEHESLLLGRGDDCAVVRPGGPWAVTCDVFAENAHFRRRYFSPADIGHKALAVNLSDVASSGARPLGCVVGLTLTGREDEAWLDAFASGMAALARRYGVALAGGDLARAGELNVCVTAWGELPPLGKGGSYLVPRRGLRRERAHPGDVVFVAGELGLARVGLSVLEATDEAGGPDAVARAVAEWPAACGRHLRPEPMVEQGLRLAELATGQEYRFSLMDVSDGLARDMPRLLGTARTGLGAALTLPETALPEEVRRYASTREADPALFAFEGGEDYALAGICPPECWDAVEAALAPRILRLGEVARGKLTLNGMGCSGGGFDHFG